MGNTFSPFWRFTKNEDLFIFLLKVLIVKLCHLDPLHKNKKKNEKTKKGREGRKEKRSFPFFEKCMHKGKKQNETRLRKKKKTLPDSTCDGVFFLCVCLFFFQK